MLTLIILTLLTNVNLMTSRALKEKDVLFSFFWISTSLVYCCGTGRCSSPVEGWEHLVPLCLGCAVFLGSSQTSLILELSQPENTQQRRTVRYTEYIIYFVI